MVLVLLFVVVVVVVVVVGRKEGRCNGATKRREVLKYSLEQNLNLNKQTTLLALLRCCSKSGCSGSWLNDERYVAAWHVCSRKLNVFLVEERLNKALQDYSSQWPGLIDRQYTLESEVLLQFDFRCFRQDPISTKS